MPRLCDSCDYRNPDGAEFCSECGAALGLGGLRRAQQRFASSLDEAKQRAKERLERASAPQSKAAGGSADDRRAD